MFQNRMQLPDADLCAGHVFCIDVVNLAPYRATHLYNYPYPGHVLWKLFEFYRLSLIFLNFYMWPVGPFINFIGPGRGQRRKQMDLACKFLLDLSRLFFLRAGPLQKIVFNLPAYSCLSEIWISFCRTGYWPRRKPRTRAYLTSRAK